MDRNQFPRRMCGLALCLLAIEVGIWRSGRGPLAAPWDTSTVVPLRHPESVEMPAVQTVSPANLATPADSSNSAESFGER